MSSTYLSPDTKKILTASIPSAAETLDSLTHGASLFLDPTGQRTGEIVEGDQEGIAYANLDLGECVAPKQFHDVVGGYQRWDVFRFGVDRGRQGAGEVVFEDGKGRESGGEEDREGSAADLDGRAGLTWAGEVR